MPSTEKPDDAVPGATGPRGNGTYKVRQGDCVASIAANAGFNWEKIWDLPENDELKRLRKGDAGALLPGDKLHLPEREAKSESCATGARHTFKKYGGTTPLRIAFDGLDGPRSGEPYRLVVDGVSREGVLDDAGRLEEAIPCCLKRVTLYLGSEPCEERFDIDMGTLDPCTELSGIQARLNQLGYEAGQADNKMKTLTRAAIMSFQEDHADGQYKLKADGIPGPKTQEAIEKEYQSHSN